MFIFRLLSKFSIFLLFLTASSIAVAAPYTVTYVDTVGAGSTTPPFNVGEAFTISIVLDNGGATAASQTWTSADIVSITFNVNDALGTITTVYSPVVLADTNGSFVTDAVGVLTAVPSDWNDYVGGNQDPAASTIASTNDPATPTTFFINGGNAVYHNSDDIGVSYNSASMTNVANNIIAANWSAPVPVAAPAPATAVPTLSQWSMLLLVLMLASISFVKARRFK